MSGTTRRRPGGGFTLVELLVVIAIIGLISAVALPVVLPALNERKVSEGARLLQAVLAGTRDAAIRANAPRGIRLLPDPGFGFAAGQPLASNRFIAIEPAPDYNEGEINGGGFTSTPAIATTAGVVASYLRVAESDSTPLPSGRAINSPTGWQFNIRQGDQIRFKNSGAIYTIVGPMHGLTTANNPERFINYTNVNVETNPAIFGDSVSTIRGNLLEYLNLMNGIDDDGDGWVDEGCDGIDNDGDGIIDPGHNGVDDDGDGVIDNPAEMLIGISGAFSGEEYETEKFLGTHSASALSNSDYIITRRPVVAANAAEVALPAGVVIDLTTWDAAASHNGSTRTPTLPERSRLPVDPFSGYVDIMVDQTGRVVPPGAGSGGGSFYALSPIASLPFYHFWITEREGVVAPLWGLPTTPPYAPSPNPAYGTQYFLLPMPQGTANYAGSAYLKGERRLVTLFTKTGQIVANSIELFDGNDTSTPFYAAQSGIKEPQ